MAVPAHPVHPAGDRPRARPRRPGADLLRRRGRDRADGGADGPGDRGAGGQVGSRRRRPAQRHLRQRPGADHRPDRAQRGPSGGGQGLDRRLDHRQHPARARRLDAGRRDQARPPDVQRPGGQHPGDDAVPRRRGAGDAGDLRAGRGPGPAEPVRRGWSTTTRRSRSSRWRSRSSSSAPTSPGSGLLAAHAQGPLQPALRRGARGGLRLERAALGDLPVRRRARGRADVRGPGRLDLARPRSRSGCRSSSSA